MTGRLPTPSRLLFASAPASRLATLRVLIGIYVLVYLWRRRSLLTRVARTDPRLFSPVGVARVLDAPLPVPVARTILDATMATNVAFILGWHHRYSGPAFAGLLLWLLCYRNSWSMIYHSDNGLVLHVMILGLAPAADALSIDSLRRPRLAPRPGSAADWRYGWPIQLMSTVTTLTYFLAGVAKVAGPLGRGWATGESLRAQIAVDGLRKELLGGGAAPLAFALYDKVALWRALALASLLIELGAPVALLDRRLGRIWAVNAWLMHVGIRFIMGIKFRYQLAGLMFASFFDLERVAARLIPRLPVEERCDGCHLG